MKCDGTYKIINGKDIIEIPQMESDNFWKGKPFSKEEYCKFIEDSQDFFEKYIQGIDCTNLRIGTNNAKAIYVYESLQNCIKVRKIDSGYMCIDNGRHRCAAAKELGLNILVCEVN